MLPKLREVYAAAGQYFEQPSEVKMKEAGQDGGYVDNISGEGLFFFSLKVKHKNPLDCLGERERGAFRCFAASAVGFLRS